MEPGNDESVPSDIPGSDPGMIAAARKLQERVEKQDGTGEQVPVEITVNPNAPTISQDDKVPGALKELLGRARKDQTEQQ